MIKPDSLRAAITAVLPGLAIEPDRLKIWVEKGSVVSRITQSLSFSYRYQLSVLVEGMVAQPSVIAIAVLVWLRTNQPELLTPGKTAFEYDADIIDNATADFGFDLDLTENVTVVRRPDGGFDMQHLAEPVPLMDDDEPLTGQSIAAEFVELWLKSPGIVGFEKLTPDTPPLGADVQPAGLPPA